MAGEVSRHHNVPSSCGGTNNKSNLSSLRHERHDLFHAWAANYTPGTLLRLFAVHANRFPERALPAGALRDILGMLTEGEWDSLYHAGVVLPSPHAGQEKLLEHLQKEEKDIHSIVGVLVGQEALLPERERFLERALVFFQTPSPRVAMLNLLRESHGHDLSWAKALCDDVRRNLSVLLTSAVPSSLPEQQRVIDILLEQERRIAQKIDSLLVLNPSLSVDDDA